MARERVLSTLHPLSPYLMFIEVLGGFAVDAGISENWLGEEWPLAGSLMTVSGAAGIVYTIWCWRGRSVRARSWAYMQYGADLAILAIPFFAFGMFGFGLQRFFNAPREIAIFFLLISGVFGVVAVLGFFDCPRWWGPGWFRRREFTKDSSAGGAPKDALGAMKVAYSTTPEVLSSDRARQELGNGGEPMVRWKGGWVHDADATEQEHPLARKGTVEGKLAWYPEGLSFAASQREDALRGRPSVVTIPAAELTGVEVVPAGAGADGRRRRGVLYRSPFPRLVVHTSTQSHVFDIAWGRARNVATFLDQQLNR